jgi:hypothetical protein
MYVDVIRLDQRTNREDFFQVMQCADDDTGQPLSLAPIVLAPGNTNGLTGSAWTVTDGGIVTTSSSTLTIPGYPIGNQLAAVALTVPSGLGIKAGDAITIVDTPTKQNSMTGFVTSYAATTGALVCQMSWTFQFEIRRMERDDHFGTGFNSFFDFGIPSNDAPLLAIALGTGISIVDIGSLQILIPESTFKQLSGPRTFKACLTGTNGIDTRQFFDGELPVKWGGVTL